MITITSSKSEQELEGILELQKSNLTMNLSSGEIQSQGFVTVQHSFEDLKKLNDNEQHVIAKDGAQVVAYLLAMTAQSQHAIPELVPMFEVFGELPWKGKSVATCFYIVAGQVCVAKGYRGIGLLDDCYRFYKSQFDKKYDFAITKIDITNQRSIKGDEVIGDEVTNSVVIIYRVDQNGFNMSNSNSLNTLPLI